VVVVTMSKRKAEHDEQETTRNVRHKGEIKYADATDEQSVSESLDPNAVQQTDQTYNQYQGYDTSAYDYSQYDYSYQDYQAPVSGVLYAPEQPAPTTQPVKKVKTQTAQSQDDGKRKRIVREAGGQRWEDTTLYHWPKGDFRIFVGNLGNDVNDDTLRNAFSSKYKSCTMGHVVRDKRTQKTKGYGFVSFLDPHEFTAALREMNGKYIGGRPCKLSKSKWEDRNSDSDKRKKKRNIINKLSQT